jgi:hypothetical protein
MRNVLDKRCKENKNTYCTLNTFFSENITVYEIISKNIVVTEGPQITSQYGAYAFRAVLARLYSRMYMHMPTRLSTHAMRKHAHTDQYVTVIAFPQQQWSRKRASVLRYKYITCLVLY